MSASVRDPSPSDTIGVAPAANEDASLIVIDGDVSRRVELPRAGALVIGRATDCDLVVEHKSASRHHARIHCERGQVFVADLDSHNGTLVNGVAISVRRRLTNGDVVSIGDVVIVVHARSRPAPRPPIGEVEWRHRLTAEVERASQYERSVAVVAIAGATAKLATWRRHVAESLRLIDGFTEAEDGQLLLLLPELDHDAAAEAARSAMRSIGDGDARAGYAAFPCDGIDADTLLLAARKAARRAPAGAVWSLSDVARRIRIGAHEVVLADPAMLRQFELIERLAAAEIPILITGETGAGKEVAALAVHHFSTRHRGPFHAVNCAAIPENLVESELFGHERGAFTGATTARPGLFEKLDGGTLFLDEIGELSLATQAKLLRVVESGTVTRVGDVAERSIDVRLVAATNRDLHDEVEAGRFRRDLYFRLAVATVLLSPLRERRCEIPILIREFLDRCGAADAQPTHAAMRCLLDYDWPGSVRELKNTIEYAAAAAATPGVIDLGDLPSRTRAPRSGTDAGEPTQPHEASRPTPARFRPIADELRELETTRMKQALAATGGVKSHAAELIGMPIRTFSAKLKQYGISFEPDDDA